MLVSTAAAYQRGKSPKWLPKVLSHVQTTDLGAQQPAESNHTTTQSKQRQCSERHEFCLSVLLFSFPANIPSADRKGEKQEGVALY